MEIDLLKIRSSINKAYLKVKPTRTQIETFKKNIVNLFGQIKESESEEFHKNIISEFLKNTYYSPNHYINTKGRSDLVIHNGKDSNSSVGVLFEVKKPGNKSEIPTSENINCKAFHELILYYLRERITNKNLEIKHLVITNTFEWFIFNSNDFEKHFAEDKGFVKKFIDFEEGRLSGANTDFFYKNIAEPFINSLQSCITVTHFDIREFESIIENEDKGDDNQLIALYKIFSREHLLKLPFANDSNNLDKSFYNELLHIIGLEETKEGNRKIIGRRVENERNPGSLIENSITILKYEDCLSQVPKLSDYGNSREEQLFNISLELVITWINRILFLKLLEGQLIKYNGGDKEFRFLNIEKIPDYDELNKLFFQVLAVKESNRSEFIKQKFSSIPYLNSSLFEPGDLEHKTIRINSLDNHTKLPVLTGTVLKDRAGRKITGDIDPLQYLFEFLDAYDFSSEGSEDIQEENKTLINASVLGLIFEKINGYKDGSFFTPGFITMYMCHETIRRAVVQKFNEVKGWNCETLSDVYNKIEDIKDANRIVNSLKICDPAVGSGHFLVSALNEIIAIKSELRILTDREGKKLKEYSVEVVNDELIITDEQSKLFDYNPKNKESQRVQEALFQEKQRIIENCLFGVDINPNSVKICRLRLWIELLKNAYYKPDTNYRELETLPNIDINIKCGNSLISRYSLDADIKTALRSSKWNIDNYREAIMTYRNAQTKDEKHSMERLISKIKNDFEIEVSKSDKRFLKLNKLNGELLSFTSQSSLFELTKTQKDEWNKKVIKLTEEIKKYEKDIEEIKSNAIYENAFEWRFEFPEVLNSEGDFVGFDVVIGNPPWGAEIKNDYLKHIKSLNSSIIVRMVDSFMFFINLTFTIKSNKGLICQIIPDVILYQIDNEKLRLSIIEKTQLEIALNLGDKIFEDVSRPSCIILLTSHNTGISYVGEYDVNGTEKISNILLKKIATDFFFQIPHNVIPTKNILGYSILKRLNGKKLLNFIDKDGIQRGISPDLKDAFIIDESIVTKNKLETEYIFPTLTGGRDMKKYLAKDIGKRIIYTKKSDSIDKIKNIVSYLGLFKNKISCKEVEEGKHPFWALHRSRGSNLFTKRSKILGVITGDKIITSIDYSEIFPTDGLFLFSSNDVYTNEFIVGVLNSKLLTYLYRLLSMEENRTLSQIKPTILQELPFDFENIQLISNIETLVNQIINVKKRNLDSNVTTSLEKEIDQLVYQLYGLSDEEIQIVENS